MNTIYKPSHTSLTSSLKVRLHVWTARFVRLNAALNLQINAYCLGLKYVMLSLRML